MAKTPRTTPHSEAVQREVMATIGRSVFREFNVAFVLMSLIPLFIGLYLLAARLFTIAIFEGLNGLYFFIAIVIALLGFLAGRQILKTVLGKLIDANVELRQYGVIKSAFIANVAYELRPPLAAVQMSLKNMHDGLLGPLTDPQRGTVLDCYGVIGRLARMTTDLIEFTGGVEGAKPKLQLDVLELQETLREVLRLNDPYLKAHRLNTELKLPAQPVLFFGDRTRLTQAFTSLLDHAVRWGSEGSTVTIELSQAVPETWQVCVAHEVAGSQADFARAIDTFTRLGGHVEEHLGLGLRLAKEIVELHLGRLWVEGEPGQHTRLLITLPSLDSQRSVSPSTPGAASAKRDGA